MLSFAIRRGVAGLVVALGSVAPFACSTTTSGEPDSRDGGGGSGDGGDGSIVTGGAAGSGGASASGGISGAGGTGGSGGVAGSGGSGGANPCAGGDCEAIIVFQDTSDPTPATWTCLSCAGGPLQGRFPVGGETFGEQGGSDAVQHTVTYSLSYSGTHPDAGFSDGPICSLDGHTHQVSAQMTPVSLPPYRNLKIIKSDFKTTQLPAGAIILLDSNALPNADFSFYAAQNGFFIRGDETAGEGGAASHSHTLSVALSSASGSVTCCTNCVSDVASGTHTHAAVDVMTDTASNIPRHREVVLAQVNPAGGTPVPVGGIVMLSEAPSSAAWTVLSSAPDAGTSWSGDFLEAAAITNTASTGSNTHGHAAITFTSAEPTGTVSEAGNSGGTGLASAAHQHQIQAVFEDADHRPPYTSVIIAKKTQ